MFTFSLLDVSTKTSEVLRKLGDDNRPHADSRPLEVFIEPTNLILVRLQTEAVEQRKKVIMGWMHLSHNASHLLKINNGLVISLLNVLPDRRVELQRPIVGLIVVHPRPNAQIVNHVS